MFCRFHELKISALWRCSDVFLGGGVYEVRRFEQQMGYTLDKRDLEPYGRVPPPTVQPCRVGPKAG